jgi:alkanesulfonate monooxygenase SsuD/methylene tetrahydromethanopterin reductase-like flavin-dependent oxidoreductase (luciferase family)
MVEFEYDTFGFAQVIAMSTSRLVTGSCISRCFARHPLLVAETATVIDLLAPGRFVIGLGNGGVSEPLRAGAPGAGGGLEEADLASLQRWGMPADRPVARMREYLEVIRLALTGEPLDYNGEFYRFREVRLSLTPSGPIPIYLGARNPHMLRLAGEMADGVFLWLVGEETTREAIASVMDGATRAGRRRDSIAMGCLVPACVDRDGEAARSAMRRHLVEFYLGRSVYAGVLARCGFPEVGEQVERLVARGDIDAAARSVPDEALDELSISGTPADCRARLGSWHERGLDALTLYVFPVDAGWSGAYRRIITEFAPGA